MQVLTWHWNATFHPANLEHRRAIADEEVALAQREHSPIFEIHARKTRFGGLLELGDLNGAEAEAAEIERIVVPAPTGSPAPASCSAGPPSNSSTETCGRQRPRPRSCTRWCTDGRDPTRCFSTEHNS
jgi:hypothetical protein